MPLGFDFSLEKLKEYRGINPKPADFETYWDTALAAMQTMDDEVELVPAAFQADGAECFDLYFTGWRRKGACQVSAPDRRHRPPSSCVDVPWLYR